VFLLIISYRIEKGPQNFVKLDHEEILTGDQPQNYIVLKPYTYALIADPIIRDKNGEPVIEKNQIKIRFGDQEIRTDSKFKDPFPLYPGEKLCKIDKLTIVPRDCVLKVRANRDFTDESGNKRSAGDEWQVKGPCIYVPRIDEDKVQLQEPIVVNINTALKIRAKYSCIDIDGKKREPGDEWLIRNRGQYLLGVNEVLVEVVNGIILTETKAIQLIATKTFTDVYGIERKAGEEWLVTHANASVHILDVYEQIVKNPAHITILRSDEYCYLMDPRNGKENRMGEKILIHGPHKFFLQPGEQLDGGIKKAYVLADDEALLLAAIADFTEGSGEKAVDRKAGERWMVKGPRSYIPPVEVAVIERRQAIPMDKLEGIYVRDTRSGNVIAVSGKTYMLNEHEELANKEVSDTVNELLRTQGGEIRKEAYKLVTYKCPFNAAVQVYDYKKRSSRVIIGPALVVLGPDEQFTVSYLSGKTPKVPGRVRTLHLLLGPVFSTDVVEVETSDHARLEIKMSYNWRFRVDPTNYEHIFNVRDFIGDMCKAMGSRVRGAIASVPFDIFHKTSSQIIHKAVFGLKGDVTEITPRKFDNDTLLFDGNGLEIFNVDIQSIEPKDKKTKESLDKTVTQAIQITTQILEAEARRQAEKSAQDAKAKIDCLVLENKSIVETAKKGLLDLKAQTEGIKTKGQALAEARATAAANEISAEAEVNFATHKINSKKIREQSTIAYEAEKHAIEYAHQKAMAELKIKKAKELADIEATKFTKMMSAIGTDTLVEIAKSGPEAQASMLSSLGLQGYMLMSSDNPINLFQTASGMVSQKDKQE